MPSARSCPTPSTPPADLVRSHMLKRWLALPYVTVCALALVLLWDSLADAASDGRPEVRPAFGLLPWPSVWLGAAVTSFVAAVRPALLSVRVWCSGGWLTIGVARGVSFIVERGSDGVAVLAIWVAFSLAFFGWTALEDHFA